MSTSTSAKALPPLPPPDDNSFINTTPIAMDMGFDQQHRLGSNMLGLGLGPIGDTGSMRGKTRGGSSSSDMSSHTPTGSPRRPPGPTYFVPLRDAPTPSSSIFNSTTSTALPTLSSSPVSSPSTTAASNSASARFHPAGPCYAERSGSTSTFQSSIRSVGSAHTLTPRATRTSEMRWQGDERDQRERPKLTGSASSPNININSNSIGKRSSGQLLSGLGKGLNRMGSVMRRNTSDPNPLAMSTSSSGSSIALSSSLTKSWRKKTKGPGQAQVIREEDGWEKVDPEDYPTGTPRMRRDAIVGVEMDSVGDEGDEGIGRPFNVEHDLHVSPSLDDLPPAWLEQLRGQGLTEKDLLLISSTRRKQSSVTNTPIRLAKLSAPPDGPRSALLPAADEGGRTRGSSTPDTAIMGSYTTLKSDEDPARDQFDRINASSNSISLSAPRGLGASLVRKVSGKGLFKKFAFDPPPAAGRASSGDLGIATNDNDIPRHSSDLVTSELEDEPTQMVDLDQYGRGGRKRTPKKNKRFSDQIRCFSQFDLGGDDAWGASLLSMMSAEDRGREIGSSGSRPSYINTSTSVTAFDSSSISPKNTSQVPTPTNMSPKTSLALYDNSTSSPEEPPAVKTPTEPKAIKRIPIPPLLPAPSVSASGAASSKRPLDLNDLNITPIIPQSERQGPSPLPPPPAKKRQSITLPTTATPEPPQVVHTPIPLRRSSDSFGVHYHAHADHDHCRRPSSVDLDLDLAIVTPSSSNDHVRRAVSPTERNASEMMNDPEASNDAGEVGFDHSDVISSTPARHFTPPWAPPRKLKDFKRDEIKVSQLPLEITFGEEADDTLSAAAPTPIAAGLSSPSTRPNHYSLPASAASSELSRSLASTPDLRASRPHLTGTGDYDHDRLDIASTATPNERTSIALSVLSSDSLLHNSLHEATVQMAYTKILGNLREVDERRAEGDEGLGDNGRQGDGSGSDTESEGALDALDALEEAARRIAGG